MTPISALQLWVTAPPRRAVTARARKRPAKLHSATTNSRVTPLLGGLIGRRAGGGGGDISAAFRSAREAPSWGLRPGTVSTGSSAAGAVTGLDSRWETAQSQDKRLLNDRRCSFPLRPSQLVTAGRRRRRTLKTLFLEKWLKAGHSQRSDSWAY